MFAWYRRRRERAKQLMKAVNEICALHKDLVALYELGTDKIFAFPMFGKEVKIYIPYARFDFIQNSILRKADFFEGDILRHVRREYFDGASCNVLDIGANIGNHSVFFSKFCNAKVVSFEPQPAIYDILKKNLELNDCNFDAHNIALGESSGFAVIDNYDASNTGATQFTKSINEGFTVCSLDQFNFKNIHFIKIDVEGFEKGVLRGAKETIKSSKPIIWIEIFPGNYEIVQNILKEYGYDMKEQLAESDYIFEPRR